MKDICYHIECKRVKVLFCSFCKCPVKKMTEYFSSPGIKGDMGQMGTPGLPGTPGRPGGPGSPGPRGWYDNRASNGLHISLSTGASKQHTVRRGCDGYLISCQVILGPLGTGENLVRLGPKDREGSQVFRVHPGTLLMWTWST